MKKYKGKTLYDTFHSNDKNALEAFKKTFQGKDIDSLVWEYQQAHKLLKFYNFQRGASLFTMLLIVPGILGQVVDRYSNDESMFSLYLIFAGLVSFGFGAYYWAKFTDLDEQFMHPTMHAKLNALKQLISEKVEAKHNGDYTVLQQYIDKHEVK